MLNTALDTLSDAPALKLSLSTNDLPSGVSGLKSTSGVGTHAPAFKGEATVVASGLALTVSVVSVNDTTWAKGGMISNWTKIDTAGLGVPNPAAIVGTSDGGFLSVFGATQGLKDAGKTRKESVVLTKLTGTLPGSEVHTMLSTVDSSSDFSVIYLITSDGELQSADITGPFYGKGTKTTYTLIATPTSSTEITEPTS
jgi:lipoprotein LprG